MDYEMIENKVKEFVEKILEECDDSFCPKNERAIAFGTILFASNNLFPCFNQELSDWWNNEMWNKFTDKIMEANNNE